MRSDGVKTPPELSLTLFLITIGVKIEYIQNGFPILVMT